MIQPHKYHDAEDKTNVGEEALAAAIVLQAVEDYVRAKSYMNGTLKISPRSWRRKYERTPESVMLDVMYFFNSKWYGILCDIPRERIIDKLMEAA